MTDENGAGSARKRSEFTPQNTNGNDDVEDESLWDDHAGTWFGLTTEGWMVDVQDELCALPFDQYTLEELPCEGQPGVRAGEGAKHYDFSKQYHHLPGHHR